VFGPESKNLGMLIANVNIDIANTVHKILFIDETDITVS
jgi:hypothetical protein